MGRDYPPTLLELELGAIRTTALSSMRHVVMELKPALVQVKPEFRDGGCD